MTFALNEWHHIAAVRSGNNYYLCYDGSCSTYNDTDALPNYSVPVHVASNGTGGNFLNGWLDEVRISKGIARWTGDFTPPTEEYSLTLPVPTVTPTITPTPVSSGAFPSTIVRDDFNRADGAIGNNWQGNDIDFNISSNRLDVTGNDAAILWQGTSFGADQEAFVTFHTVDLQGGEQDLLLKSQSNSGYGTGVIEVLYEASKSTVTVWTYGGGQGWEQHGAAIPVTFTDGDVFGARALADGTVEVYRNGVLIGTRDVSSWPFYDGGGYIGLWFINATEAVVDDFGGGTVAGSTPAPLDAALLHMNGEDGSTTFVDTTGRTWTTNGDAQMDTAQSKLGGASGLFDGSGDDLSTADSDDFYFDGDFTIDFWMNLNSFSSDATLYAQRVDGSNRFVLYISPVDNSINLVADSGGSNLFFFTKQVTFALNEWHHIAAVRSGDNYYLCYDGSCSTYADTDAPPNLALPVTIASNGVGWNYLNGWLDEVRISKGIARWTGDFTPPASEYELATPTPPVTDTPTAMVPPTVTDTPTATLTPTATDTPTPTFTPTIILPPTYTPTPLPAGPVTIDYTYDALHRLTGATYSDGRTFDYTYDAAGNVLQLEQNLGPGTVTTVYEYDAVNQLDTAEQGSTTWQYTYDANGSLVSDGVKTYTYDSANRLVQVSNQSTVTSLSYNGLGQRLSMDAAGVIAHYVMDGDSPLTAETGGNNTYYLYGLGAIGEKTTSWAYSLADGTNTPRQLSNGSGTVTLSARYTPWGDTLDLNGTGNFSFGYFGGVMDAATGLIYVGNGQYYDPETGRFLTRDAKPNQTNPYVPWDPTGAIIAPLGIVALFAGRKKKGSKVGTFLVLLIVLGGVGMTLAACVPGPVTVTVIATPEAPLATATATFADGSTASFATPMPGGTPSQVLGVPCPTPSGNVPAPTGTLIPTPLGSGNIYRLTDIDWEGSGFFQTLGGNTTLNEISKQAIFLALDMLQRLTGRTAENLVHWISNSNLGVRVIPMEGTSPGGDSGGGSLLLYAAQTPVYLSPDGLGLILHELAHGIDVTVGYEKGYGESFSTHTDRYGMGWNADWMKDASGNFVFMGDLRGPANTYLDNPTEDFASSFASVVIENNIRLGLMNVSGTLDLSAYIQLKSGNEAPPWQSFGYVDDTRRIPIEQILGLR